MSDKHIGPVVLGSPAVNAHKCGIRRVVTFQWWPGGRSINAIKREVYGLAFFRDGWGHLDIRFGRWAR